MKIKSLLLGMMTCAALAACSNEDIVDNEGGNNSLKGEAYVAVNIVMPNGSGARATGDFEAGTAKENEVTSATFLFFDQAGNGCVAPITVAGDKLEAWKSGTGSVDKISAPVLLLNPVNGVSPTSMIAILNPTEAYTLATKLSDIKSAKGNTYGSTASFLMSNSVYADGSKVITEVPITLENLASSAALAEQHPVVIPVERTVAKVTIAGKNVTSTAFKENIGGVETDIKVVIKGWKVTATNPDSYLTKQINSTWSYTWGWNDAVNKRSYWASSATPAAYTYYSYAEAVANMSKDSEYCMENTSGTPTKLWVVAEIQNNDGNAIDLTEWMGVKYTKTGLKNYVATLLNKYYYLESGTEGQPGAKYSALKPEHIAFTANDVLYKANIALATSAPAKFYTITTDGAGNVTATVDATAALKAEIAGMQPLKAWTNGMSYYYTDIIHESTTPLTGIVRNHVYKLTINSIAGLGTPVYDPSDKVVPEKPVDDKSYVAAEVQVLKWRVVEQGVDLQ